MNSRKLGVLNTLDDAARVHDESLKRSIDVVAHPEQYGWRSSILTAAIVLPLTGISAVLTDLSRVLVARSDDEAWTRALPSPESDPPSAEHASEPAVDGPDAASSGNDESRGV